MYNQVPSSPQQQKPLLDPIITIQVPRQALYEGCALIVWHLQPQQGLTDAHTETAHRMLLRSLLQAIQAQAPQGIGPTYRAVIDQLAELNQANSEQEQATYHQWFITNDIPIQQDRQTLQWKLK